MNVSVLSAPPANLHAAPSIRRLVLPCLYLRSFKAVPIRTAVEASLDIAKGGVFFEKLDDPQKRPERIYRYPGKAKCYVCVPSVRPSVADAAYGALAGREGASRPAGGPVSGDALTAAAAAAPPSDV